MAVLSDRDLYDALVRICYANFFETSQINNKTEVRFTLLKYNPEDFKRLFTALNIGAGSEVMQEVARAVPDVHHELELTRAGVMYLGSILAKHDLARQDINHLKNSIFENQVEAKSLAISKWVKQVTPLPEALEIGRAHV